MRTSLVVALCVASLICESCDYPATPVAPSVADYDKIAFEMMTGDAPPPFMREFKSILTVCVGTDSSTSCSNQVAAVLRSRGLVERKQAKGYALFFNTQYDGAVTRVVISLTNPKDELIYQHTAEITTADQMKAAHNLRAALAWKFATKWAIANHLPPKLVTLESFLDL